MGTVNQLIKKGCTLFLFVFLSLSLPYSVIGQERLNMSLSCKKLRKSAESRGYSFVRIHQGEPFENQMRQPKTVYVVSSSFDLGGKVFNLPDSSYVCFKKKGAIRNDPRCFGAIGDGRNDDTKVFQSILDLHIPIILLKGRTYYIDGYLIIPSNVTIKGEGARIVLSAKDKAFPGFEIRRTSSVTIAGITICAKKTKQSGSPFTRTTGTLWSNRYAITASSVEELTIADCTFVDVEYAIKIDGGVGNNNNITIKNCITEGSVATPVYVSHSDNVIIDGCVFHASIDASKFDHHLYGCASNRHHLISNCSFYDGVGIPVHYYTTEVNGVDDVLVQNCYFENTCGAVIVSSRGEGTLTVRDAKMNSSREYENGVFCSGGNQTLIVEGASVNAPHQRLISCEGTESRLRGVIATVGGFAYGLPSATGLLSVEGCQISLRSAPYVLYVSEKVAPKTGDVTLVGNRFLIDNSPEYLFSVRGTTKGTVSIENNEILCKGNVKFAVYNAGKTSSRLLFNKNHIKGVAELRHFSVKGGVIDNNTLER